MSFFGLPGHDLEAERESIRKGGGLSEDVAVYTWGEESYDGLGDALQEGGDDFNDETFGDSGTVGKDFDFAGQPGVGLLESERSAHPVGNRLGPDPQSKHLQPEYQQVRHTPISLESIWNDSSLHQFADRQASPAIPRFSPFLDSSPSSGQSRTLQDIEADMIARASQSRQQEVRRQQRLLQEDEERMLQEQVYQRQRLSMERERENRELQLQALQRLQQQQMMQMRQQATQHHAHQRTPPPRMITASQSPRFLDQRQMLLLQQQQREDELMQLRLQEQLQIEDLERQLRAQQISQLNQGPAHFPHRRLPSGPSLAEMQALQQQQQMHRRQHSQSPGFQEHNGTPQQIQQQRLLAEMAAQAEYLREVQGTSHADQEVLRAEAMRKIVEAERMEDRRRRKAAKIAHMARYNDLMTQSDKDFITRIQVSQLVTPDPYADDFYAQVYSAIQRSRMGLQSGDERILKFGSSGGISLGAPQKGPTRRPNAMQRMEQQVERIVSAARKREAEKGTNPVHNLQGALGKTSGRSYKAAPRQLLQVDDNASPPVDAQPNEAAALETARMNQALGDAGVVRQDPLTRREVLTILESLYDLVLKVEHLRREQPDPQEDEAALVRWQVEYDQLVEQLWEGLRVMVPLETSNPHPFVSLLGPSKGKKILPRLTRHIGPSRMLTLMTLLVACFHQLDVVRSAPLLDSLDDSPERAEADRQTQAFLTSVLQSILPIVAKLELHVVTALMGLLIDRSPNVGALAMTKPGLALLTLFLSRVEIIKQSWTTGQEAIEPSSAEAALFEWQTVFDQFFVLLTPNLALLFPSSRIILPSQVAPTAALEIDIMDQPVWQFLAALALQAVPDQHSILVTSLREKVLENVLSANKGWVADEDERRTKLANVNLFLHALGLDSSQINL
ncbi:unnamed protein product [Mycena citricolor]|uniref:mRNA decay factor PAT1 domain-containing protein n=1 Tax=Mycena citricolor TaxID=2018698 RepID=A0AAD2JXM9_9AGAR|nr:unnamed protein product [Mycena citricolor]